MSGEQLGEDYFDFYGDVIASVVALNDRRAIPALLGAIDTGGMATRCLASFGDAALPGLFQRVRDLDPMVRIGVTNSFAEILSKFRASSMPIPSKLSRLSAHF